MKDLKFDVVNKLIQKNISITAAESLTAGKFLASLGDVPGVSKILAGGLVTYSNEAKHDVLGVPDKYIEQDGVVSSSVSESMADNARRIYHADIGISFTGAAGPDSLEGHPAGTVWIGISFKDQETVAHLYHFEGDRNAVRSQCVQQAYQLIAEKIK